MVKKLDNIYHRLKYGGEMMTRIKFQKEGVYSRTRFIQDGRSTKLFRSNVIGVQCLQGKCQRRDGTILVG